MVSRRSTGPLRTILPAVAVGILALGVVGCSAGQATQTDSVEPAVNGNRANVGEIALRDVVLAYPEEGGPYQAGDDAPLVLTIVNIGGTDDELTAVTSPAAAEVELLGDVTLPGRSRLQVVVPDESTQPATSSAASSEPESTESAAPGSSSAEPSESSAPPSESESAPEPTSTEVSAEEVGMLSIVLTDLTANLPTGRNVPITFVFAEAGEVTVNVPIGSPATPRPEAEHEGGSE